IMQTVVMGEGGEIFVLDMGEPIKISYLAEQMIHLSGRTLGQDIQIEYIGLRPGEKLYEELFHEKEELAKTSHQKVLLAHHRQVDWQWLNGVMQQMSSATEALDSQQLRLLLGQLVPEHEIQTKPETSNKASA
ncbi:MAG: polysaccharide biosynthesis protein, partial [Candidatus Thiodiazotropha taylori]